MQSFTDFESLILLEVREVREDTKAIRSELNRVKVEVAEERGAGKGRRAIVAGAFSAVVSLAVGFIYHLFK